MNLDVELSGGPLDGHRTTVPCTGPQFDVWLFTRKDAGRREVLAYAMSGRTCEHGKRWVLGFLYEVAKVGQVEAEKLKSEKLKEEGGAA